MITIVLEVQPEGASRWLYEGLVPADESLRVDPESATINELRNLLRTHGAVPVGTLKPPIVAQFVELLAGIPRVEGAVQTRIPVHRGKFEIVDFRRAHDPTAVVQEALRTEFRVYLDGRERSRLNKVKERVAIHLQKRVDDLLPFAQSHRPDVIGLRMPFDVDFARGLTTSEIEVDDGAGAVPLSLRGQGIRSHLRLAAFEWSAELFSRLRLKG